MRRPGVRGAVWLSAGAARWSAVGIPESRRQARKIAVPAAPQVHVPPPSPSPAPAPDVPTPLRRRAPRAALGVGGIVLLAALGAAVAFFATRDERRASAATAAVAGTA